MSIALVAGNAVALEDDASASSINAPAFTNNITNGNFLVAFVNWYGITSGDDAVVTDSAGNTWTRTETGPTYSATDNTAITCYYAQITAGGGTKPTVTASFYTDTGHGTPKSVLYKSIHVSEWSGAATSSQLDQHGSNYQSGVGDGTDIIVVPSATVTPSTNGQLVIGMMSQSSGAIGNQSHFAVGTGFTQLNNVASVSPAGYYYVTEYLIQGAAAAVQVTGSQSGTAAPSVMLSLMATFKGAAAGGGVVGSYYYEKVAGLLH